MKVDGDRVILCCGAKGCPSLKIVDNAVEITFDDGRTSPPLSFDEIKMMPAGLEKLLEIRDAV
jgi:hypothetical protein